MSMDITNSRLGQTVTGQRELTAHGALDAAVSVLAVVFSVYIIYFAYSLFTFRLRYSVLFVGLGLALYYLQTARDRYEERYERTREAGTADANVTTAKAIWRRVDPPLAVVSAGLALLTTGYIEYHFTRLHQDVHVAGYTQVDLYVGVVLIVLSIDATRRAFGNVVAGVTVASILYAHNAVGPYLPGVFRHTGFDWTRISREGAIGLTGVYHDTLMGIGATWVAIFIVFAGIAKHYGLLEFILEMGEEIGKRFETGIVQVAVIGSMIMGSVTGAAVANTATTGSFTIPMMKEQGVRKDFSAAIEAVASAGGQMLPPVMGVAAFLMADILGISYLSVVRAGTIPAVLFYLSVGAAIHFAVLKNGWTTSGTDAFDRALFWKTLQTGVHFIVPLGVLLVTLIYLRYTPLSAGMYTIFSIFLIGTIKTVYSAVRDQEFDSETVWVACKDVVLGLRKGGLEIAPLVGVIAVMGIIIEMMTQTGLSQRISTMIVGLSGGSLLVVLLLAMGASILFGLGMPTPAAYILVVILVAPSVIEMGVADLTTHMFVFYFAMLSAITPPVAMSVVVGSRIAGSDFLTSCVQALRIAAPGFAIPFTFVTNDGLLQWSSTTLVEFPAVLIGTIALVTATIGYDGRSELSYPKRGLFVVAACGAMFGGLVSPALQIAVTVAIGAYLLYANVVR